MQDKHLWTAGGATAGIDMALAMLREDHGTSLVPTIARRLLVYAHRPGNQSQFSALLERVRLAARAKSLLDAGHAVSVVATDVGFRSSFESHFGVSPSIYRALQSGNANKP